MKIDRLFAITNILVTRKTITANELAHQFDVSVRTIYRDIEILSMNGIPVYTLQGKGGGISIMDGYSIDRTLLSDDEQKQVLMALESMKAAGNIDVEDSILKLRSVFKKETTNWIEIDFASWEQSDEEKRVFEVIKEGIFNATAISFSYFSARGESTERVVEPLKLVFKGNSWYLYGYCRMRKDFRFFKLRRIDDIAAIYGDAVKEKFPDYISKRYKKKEEDQGLEVVLKIHENMAYRIYDEFRNGIIKKEDKHFIVEATLPVGEWLYPYLMGFGSTLEVLEPMNFRNTYKSEIEKILKKY